MILHIYKKQSLTTIALNSNLKDLTVSVFAENLELNYNANLINKIKKSVNKFQVNDLGIKFSENSELQDIRDTAITNRTTQRTKVGIYQINSDGEKYNLVICDSPIVGNGLKVVIKNTNKPE